MSDATVDPFEELIQITGPAAAAGMARRFLGNARTMLDELSASPTDQDLVRAHTHRLVSTTGQYGMMDVSEAAQGVERKAKAKESTVDDVNGFVETTRARLVEFETRIAALET